MKVLIFTSVRIVLVPQIIIHVAISNSVEG